MATTTTSATTVSEAWTKAANGAEIYTRTWAPASPPVATVVFVHGLGEHVNRYNHVFPVFAAAGIKVHSFDSRGFGRTVRRSGQLGDNQGFKTFFADIQAAIDATRIDGVPLFLMGHSMGGGIALLFSSNFPDGIRGVIASAPLIGIGKSAMPNAIERAALKVLPYVASSIAMKSTVKPSDLSRDEEVNKVYTEDPYVHPWGTIGTLSCLLQLSDQLQTKISKTYSLPVLITHGTSDQITCPISSRKFFEVIPSKDKTYKSFEGHYHELHNEPGTEKDAVIKLYVDWILEHIK